MGAEKVKMVKMYKILPPPRKKVTPVYYDNSMHTQ